MLQPTIFGFASTDDVEEAITARVRIVPATSKDVMATLVGDAIGALVDINRSIPHDSVERHLVAGALEKFANG